MLSRPIYIFAWLLLLATILWLLPQTAGLKWSNLDYRQSTGVKRQWVDTRTTPWNAVGRLKMPRGICSATLIGVDVIVTARHCLAENSQSRSGFSTTQTSRKPNEVMFQLERDGSFADVSLLKDIYLPPVTPGISRPALLRSDYAFARLLKPVPLSLYHIGSLPSVATHSPQQGSLVNQAGYGGNPKRISADEGCLIVAITNNSLVQHNCLINFGDSGGPLFYGQNDSWSLVGINSYMEELNGVKHAFAIGPENYYRDLTNFIRP